MREEPQGVKGLDLWDKTGPEGGQLRKHKADVWIQGLTRWISEVVTLIFRSLVSHKWCLCPLCFLPLYPCRDGVSGDCTCCPSQGWVKDQICQATTAIPRGSPWFAPLFLILLHGKATPLLKTQLSTQWLWGYSTGQSKKYPCTRHRLGLGPWEVSWPLHASVDPFIN